MKKGIDVSYANGSIDWSKVKKAGIEFAILRSTFGSEFPSQIDSQYFQNAQGCVKNNIPFATYHFAYFVNEQTAKAEADFAIKKANEYKSYIKFIVLDVEEDSVRYAKNMGYNPDWTACSVVFMEKVKAAGYIPVLYSNYNWLKNIFNYNKLKNYKLWYAAPNATKPAYTCAIWQYSWKGKVNGINGDVDMDYLYDDSLFTTTKSTTSTNTSTAKTASSTTTTTVDDKTKFLNTARSYIGKNGTYVCKTKLGLKVVVDWCAYAVSAIMKDCGFIGKYQGGIYSYASDNARNDNGKYGTWFLQGSKAPQAGDLIMFKYASFTNPIDKYSASHVGIVESVNGNTITTLEGNVDGNSSNWAETSTFKRKTRYLNSNDVYSFFRFNWKSNTTSTSSNTKTTNTSSTITNIDVNYKVYANNKWLPTVKNTTDYAGLENKSIYGVYVKPTKGHLKYRVKLVNGGWLPWVQDMEDFAGVSNLNKQIDCIQMTLTGISGYIVEYRVSTVNSKDYLPWVKEYNNKDCNGYAGIKGVAIDKLQIRIVKK